jgi:hypothetical protein
MPTRCWNWPNGIQWIRWPARSWEGRCDAEIHQRSQPDAGRNHACYALETVVCQVFSAGADFEQVLGTKERHRGSLTMIRLSNLRLSRMAELTNILPGMLP